MVEVKQTPRVEQKQTLRDGHRRKAKTEGPGPPETRGSGRGPKRIQYALKENMRGYEGLLKAWMGTGR